jgi:hypothetical protein
VPIKTQKSSIFQQPRFKTSNKHLPNSTLHPKTIKKKQRKRSKLYNPIHIKTKDLQTETIAKTKARFRTQLPYAKQNGKREIKEKTLTSCFFKEKRHKHKR